MASTKSSTISLRLNNDLLNYLRENVDFYQCSSVGDFIKRAIQEKLEEKTRSEIVARLETKLDEHLEINKKILNQSVEVMSLVLKNNQTSEINIQKIAESLATISKNLKEIA